MNEVTHRQFIAAQFERCRHWIEAALSAEPIPSYTIDDVARALACNQAQLWPSANAAVVSEIITYPTGARVLHHWLAGGDHDEIVQTHRALEQFARQEGCVAIEVKARRGWLPTMRKNGFEPAGTYFVKRLDDGQAGETDDHD